MRKICVITGSRAEYGLLTPLLEALREEADVALQIAVTGAHLSAEFGNTYRAIEDDGFEIAAKVEMLAESDSRADCARSLGRGVIGFADALADLSPDLVVLLGDRFEILAAAEAAMVQRIPVAHLHGGEVTEGAMDESIRHAITKMAQLHFVAADDFARRVIQLGEDPRRVFTVGAVGLDALARLELLDRTDLERELDFELGETPILVTYHPETSVRRDNAADVRELLHALEHFEEAHVVFTQSNADPGHRAIEREIARWVDRNTRRAKSVQTLGQLRYLSLLREAALVAGNSSSAIIEAPALGTPSVNIGDRQKGRPKAASIIDCAPDADSIGNAIARALDPSFRAGIANCANPYGGPGASRRIVEILRSVPLDNLLAKSFHDLPAAG